MGDVVCCLVSSRGMTKVSFRMAAWSLMGTLKEWLGGLGLVRRMGEEKGFFMWPCQRFLSMYFIVFLLFLVFFFNHLLVGGLEHEFYFSIYWESSSQLSHLVDHCL